MIMGFMRVFHARINPIQFNLSGDCAYPAGLVISSSKPADFPGQDWRRITCLSKGTLTVTLRQFNVLILDQAHLFDSHRALADSSLGDCYASAGFSDARNPGLNFNRVHS